MVAVDVDTDPLVSVTMAIADGEIMVCGDSVENADKDEDDNEVSSALERIVLGAAVPVKLSVVVCADTLGW